MPSGNMRRRLLNGLRRWRRHILPYIGNDIVDLIHQPDRKKSTDLRFLKKILTDTEVEQVRNSCHPEAELWSFWACKEAAYKVIQKKNNGSAFVPRRWSVFYQTALNAPADPLLRNNYRDGEVAISGFENVHVRLFSFPAYLHCLAAETPDVVKQVVAGVDCLPDLENDQDADPSSFVRMRLIYRLAGDLFLPQKDMRIIREAKDGGLGAPLLYVAGLPSAIDISISHDERYVAYAYAA